MFNDLKFDNMFNGLFGKVSGGMCRLDMHGRIAIKTENGFKTYNLEKRRLTNVSNFCFDAGDFFFVMPTSSVKVGDIILVHNKPKCVISVNGKESIEVIDYESSEVRVIVPERHVFMGSTYFYGKIVSIIGTGNMKGKGVMGKMMNMMMIKSMFGGGNSSSEGCNGIMNMMMMQQLFDKDSGNMFENMFDLSFDGEEDVEIENDNREE